MKKRLLSWLLVLTMITSLIPSTLITSALAAALSSQYAAVYNAANLDSATSFENGKTYCLTGTGNVPVKISAGNTVTIVLNGVTINSTTSPIQVETGAKLTLIPRNNTDNTLTCISNTAQAVTDNSAGGLTAGISVPEGAELVIDKDDAGDGTLTVTGGYGGAGIGGGYGGSYSATKAATGNDGTPGTKGKWNSSGGNAGLLGTGGTGGRYGLDGSNAGTITVNGSVLAVTGGTGAAAIGGGKGVDGEAGAKGNDGTQGGVGNRSGDNVLGNGSSGGAGAGGNGGNGGAGGNGGKVTINGGTVTANATGNASAIGGGSGGVGGNGGNGGNGGAALDGYTQAFHWGDLHVTQGGGGAGGNGAGGYAGRGGQGGNAGTLTITGGKVNATGYNGFGPGAVGQDGTNGSGTRTDGSLGNAPNVVWTAHPNWSSWGDAGEYYSVAQNNYTVYVAKPTIGGNGGDVGSTQAPSNANGDAGTLTITGSSANVDFTSTGRGDLTNGRPTDKNGDALYRVELTVYNLEKDATIKDANVNVTIPASSGKVSYTYKTVSENNGKAVLWLPAGTYTLEQKAVNHTTLGEIPKDAPVTLEVAGNDSNKQDVMIGVVVKLTADRTNKVYFAQDSEKPVNIQVDTSEVKQPNVSVKWFRETVNGDNPEYAASDIGNKKSFDDRYSKIADGSGDKGTLTNATAKVYSLPINQNGRYWVQIAYTANGVPVKLVKGLVVSNIYREYPIKVRSYIYEGVDSVGQPILRQDTGYTDPPDKAGAPTAQAYGFAWDLNGYDAQNPNGANLLSSDVAPYDTLILNAKTANHTWYVAEVNGNPFADTTSKKDFESIKLTLDGSFFQNQYCDSENSVKDPGKYTIRYSARDGALDVVTISGVIKDAAPGTDPLYTHTRSYTDAIDNDSITSINWPEYKLVGVQVNGTDKPLDKDVDGKTTSSITITDIHGKDSDKENKIQTVTFLYKYNMTDVTINAWYEGTTTPVEGLSSYKEKMEIDKEYTPTAPAVDGHGLTSSSLQDGKFTPTGNNDVITFYYTKSSGNVTYKAVDGDGKTLWTGSGKVDKGHVPSEVTPDYGITNMTKDDTVATKYTKTANNTAYGNDNKYDGVNDMTVTYTYKHITRKVVVQKIDITKPVDDAVFETETATAGSYNVGSYQTIAPANPTTGYEIVGDNSKTVYIEAGNGDLVVKFYYRPSATAEVTIKLFEVDDSGKKVGTEPFQTMTVKVSYGQEQTINAPTITGWKVTGDTTKKVNLKNGETAPVIEFLYKPVYDTITVELKNKDGSENLPQDALPTGWTGKFPVQQGQSFTITAPNVNGYRLNGDTLVVSKSADELKIEENRTITFKYDKIEDVIGDYQAKVTIKAQYNGYVLADDRTQVVTKGKDATVVPDTFEGYVVSQYKLGENGTLIDAKNGVTVNVTENTDLYLIYTRPDNSVVLPGGDGQIPAPSDQDNVIVKPGVGTTIEGPKADGSVKIPENGTGTVTRPDPDNKPNGKEDIIVPGGTTIDKDGTIHLPDNAGTITPEQKIPEDLPTGYVAITYDSNNSNQEVKKEIGKAGVLKVSDSLFTDPSNRSFAGWNDSGSGNGKTYAKDTTVSANITLYAVWDAQYRYSTNIIYKANDGTTNQDTQLVGHATDPVLKGKLQNSPFQVSGWTFGGWNEAANGSGTLYQPGDVLTLENNVNKTLFAQWFKKNADDSITIPGSDGNPNNPDTNATGNGNGKENPSRNDKGEIEVPKGGSVTLPNGSVIGMPDGGKLLPDGTVIINRPDTNKDGKSDGTITIPGKDGTNPDVTDKDGKPENKKVFTLIYDINNGEDDEVLVKVVEGDAVSTIKNPFTWTGHIFLNWMREAGAKEYPAEATVENVTDREIFHAQWAKVNPDGSIELPGKDGILDGTDTATGTDHSKDNVTVTPADPDNGGKLTPQPDGSVKVEDNNGGTVNRPKDSTDLDAGREDIKVPNGTVVAPDGTIHLPDDSEIKPGEKLPDATPNGYVSVVYKANGGTGDDVIDLIKNDQTTINAIKNPFTNGSQTFTGWNTTENGINGTAYGEGAEITGITGKSVTLYAQWTKSTTFKYSAKLIYLPNDGTGEANKIDDTVGANDSQTFSENLRAANTFTVTGWTFGGWNTAANGSGDLKAANAVVEVRATVDQTWYAQWYKTNADGSITVPGKDGNPNTAGDNVTANGNGQHVTRDDATGNIEIPAGGSVITPNGEITLPDGGILKPDGTVIINLPDTNNSGKPDNTITVPGANGTDPDVKDENGNTDNTKTAVVLTYQANNGSGKEVKVYTVSGKATQALAKDTFTYSGHKFLYWQSGDKTYQAADEITPNGNMTLSAVWAKVNPDGSIELPGKDGKLDGNNGEEKDNVIVTPDSKDGLEGPKDDGSVEVKPDHDATVTRPDPDPTKPDTKEDIKVPAGTVILPDGTIKLPAPDNTEIKPGDKIPETTTTYVTVTFEAGNGTGSTIKQIVNKNSKINLLDESAFTAPDNHFFVGWKDADGKSYDAGVEYDVGTAAVTFTAQYQDRDNLTKAVAIFDYAGGTDINGNGSKYITGKADAAITGIADPTRTGYTFAGWGNADLKFGASGSVTEFTAQWTIKSYNVTFEVGDDTKGTMTGYTAPVEVEYGKSVASADIPSIAASAGNVFVGWLNSSDNSVYTADSLKNYVVTGDVTFTAQYVDASLATVIFVYAGGTLNGEHSKLITGTEGSAIGTLPVPTRDGYTLTGWTPVIANNATFGAAGTVTVYTAEWDENEKQPFTVTFDIDATKGSTADTTTETVADGGFVTKVPTVTAKAGYRFVGWMDQDNKLFYEAGLLLYPITKNTTFTAQFEEVTANPGTATVIFDANGGKIGNNSVLTKVGVPGTVVGIPTEPTRNGYKFLGWSGGFDASTVYGAESTTQTYTAQWEPIEYTIHFSATGASGATADQTYKFDGTTKNTLNRNGFTLTGKDFLGWSLTDGATTADFADGALINDTLRAALAASNGSITLYAVWADGVNNTLTVTGNKATAKRDETVDFTAYLNGVATDDVTWIVTGGQSGTHIDANGVLTIGSNESNGTVLTVTAIYKNDTSLTANATVRVVVNSNNNGGNNGGGTVSSSFVIKASAGNGGSISPSGNVSVKRGNDQTFVINPINGYRIADVIVDGKSVGAVSLYTFENVRANHTIEVVFTKLNSIVADPTETGVAGWLQTREHIAYLGGYGNGLFGPNDNMTRAQVAQMFYNLLLEKDILVTTSFSDVPADAWYAKAVNTLASLGIIKGIGNDQFAPNRTITRAEFTVIAMRFANVSATVTNPFSDIASSDWYYTAVTSAVSYGWITGYSDGTFKPMATITRAEVATIVNRMLARTADRNFVDSSAVTRFDDVPATYWAYYNIAEATTAHTHTIDNDGVESWGRLM